jgi:hypothetical protein
MTLSIGGVTGGALVGLRIDYQFAEMEAVRLWQEVASR